MPITKVIAKKDFLPIFKKGDKATIVPVLYEQDTLIRHELNGVFDENGNLVKFFEFDDLRLKKVQDKTWSIQKVCDPLYAPKGSYKDSYIELEDGKQYPSSLIRRYEDFFEKV